MKARGDEWSNLKPLHIWSEPEDQGRVIHDAITSAKYSVDIVIWEIGGPKIIEDLKIAKQHGVDIRILFNGQFFVGPDKTNSRYDQVYAVVEGLTAAKGKGRVAFHWASNNFNITHQKTIIIDATSKGKPFPENKLPASAKVLILTMNLCPYAWMLTESGPVQPLPWQFWGPVNPELGFPLRDFGVALAEPEIVVAVAKVFQFDFGNWGPGANPYDTLDLKHAENGLVWSNGTTAFSGYPAGYYPDYDPSRLDSAVDQGNARSTLLSLIGAARQNLVVYNEEMNDDEIVKALCDAARKSVRIRVLMTGNVSVDKANNSLVFNSDKNFRALAQAGAKIRLFPARPKTMYIHAKVLLADYGSDRPICFMGSQNISGNSLNFNRELGVKLQGRKNTRLFIETFENDWQETGLIRWPQDGSRIHPQTYSGWLPTAKYRQSKFDSRPMIAGCVEAR